MTDIGASAIGKNKRSTAYKLSESAVLIFMGMYFFFMCVARTTIKPDFPDHRDRYIFAALVVTTIIRLALLLYEDRINRNKWLKYIAFAMMVGAVYYMMYHVNPKKMLAFLAILTLGTIGIDYMKVLRIHAFIAAIVLPSAMFMAITGAIDNYVYIRDMTIRSSWGMVYPTNLISLLFFLLLVFWVIMRDKGDLWFLIPGAGLFAASYYVAQSRTGMLCAGLFMITVIANHFIVQSEREKLKRNIGIMLCATFPLFTVLMNGLVLAYKFGLPGANKINVIMSDRLALSLANFEEYGVKIFGNQIEQIGNGGTAFTKPEYNFIDISYCLLLIEYGIAGLLLINILWIAMTRSAIRIGDSRLAFALALVAVNSTSEHHIMEITYNIFIVLPFAIIAADISGKREVIKREKAGSDSPALMAGGKIQSIIVLIAALVAAYFILISILPVMRTVLSLISIDESKQGRTLLFAIVAVGVVLGYSAIWALYKLGMALLRHDKTIRKANLAYISIIAVTVAAAIGALLFGERIVSEGAGEYADTISEEAAVIDAVQSSKSGDFYVSDLPSLYKNVRTSIFNGEELGRYKNATIVMDKSTDTPCLFDMGFLYTQISDKHAIFTNDESVIEKLQTEGYHLTSFNPQEREYDLKDAARRNHLRYEADDSITIREGESLSKGPYVDLRAGRYTITYDLVIDPLPEADDEVCKLITTYYKGEYTIGENAITGEQVDADGNCIVNTVIGMPDAENTAFCIYPAGSYNINVRRISYQKTPEYDLHVFYDRNNVRIREEGYDLDGRPYTGTWGYFAKEFGYDAKGNIIQETYYDDQGNRTLSVWGISEIKRTYNKKREIAYEEYYGTDGKRTTSKQGHSAVGYTYDKEGHQTDLKYYDKNDQPTIVGGDNWGGFNSCHRTYDSLGRIVREDFLDEKGNPVMLKDGYASREIKYDENNAIIGYSYYDTDGIEIQPQS